MIEDKKSDAASYGYRAEAYGTMGDVEKAAADFDSAIKLDNTNFSYYLGNYNLLALNGEDGKAKEVLSAAYALKTKTLEDYFNLAVIHYLSGDLDLAAVEMGEAVANGFLEANYYLGNIYEQKKDLKNALYYYEQYAADAGSIQIAAYYNGIANCYMEQEDYEKALDAVEQGLNLKDLDYQSSLLCKEVAIYEKLLDYDNAAHKAEAYLDLYPEDAAMKKELIFLQSRMK